MVTANIREHSARAAKWRGYFASRREPGQRHGVPSDDTELTSVSGHRPPCEVRKFVKFDPPASCFATPRRSTRKHDLALNFP